MAAVEREKKEDDGRLWVISMRVKLLAEPIVA
jgi:hypothetical protein